MNPSCDLASGSINVSKKLSLEAQRCKDREEVIRRISVRKMSKFVPNATAMKALNKTLEQDKEPWMDKVKRLYNQVFAWSNSLVAPQEAEIRRSSSKMNKNGATLMPGLILFPHGRDKSRWDMLVTLLLVYIVVTAPVQASFNVEATGWLKTFEDVSDILFIIDIALTFNTGIYRKNQLVVDRKQIAMQYLKTWLLLDVVAVFPFSWVFSSNVDNVNKLARLPKLIRVLKMLRLLKILRVARIRIILSRLESIYGVHAGFARLGKMIFWILVVNHILCCIWFLIPNFGGALHPNSWIVRHGIENATLNEQYVASAYWVFSTLTTVGYGDITPYTKGEKAFSLVVMGIGVTWYAFIVSSMSSIMGSFDTHNAVMRERLLKLKAFMRDANIPRSLRRRLQENMEQVSFDKSNLYEADNILSDVPAALRVEVMTFMYRDMISEIAYLKNKSPQFCIRIVTKLNPLFVTTGDTIMEYGTDADEMFFLTKGRAQIMRQQSIVGEIQAGSYFGDVSCLLSDVRRISIRAVTLCELYTLKKRDLFSVMADYPEFALELKHKAKARAKMGMLHGTSDANVTTSLSPSIANLKQRARDARQIAMEHRIAKTLEESTTRVHNTIGQLHQLLALKNQEILDLKQQLALHQ